MKYALLWLLVEGGGRLPPWLLYALADVAGELAWLASPRIRETTRDHMAHIPALRGRPAAQRRASRACVRSAARYWVDLARYAHVRPDAARAEYRVEGRDRIAGALAAGHGAILLTAHVGAPEFAMHIGAQLGLDLLGLTQRNESASVNALLHSARRRHGVRFAEADLGGTRAAIEQLRAGGVVALVGDRDIDGTGRSVPFFGERTTLPAGPVELSRRTGAPILPCSVLRTGPARYTLRFGAPLTLPGDRDDAMGVLAGALERLIEAAPEQWFVLQPIWSGVGLGPRTTARSRQTRKIGR